MSDMLRRLFVYLALIVCILPLASHQSLASNSDGTQESKERTPITRQGVLANGVRYVVVDRKSGAFNDSDHIAIRMRVEGGWQAESEGESGLVHLIEHLSVDANGKMSSSEVTKMRDSETLVTEWGAWTSPTGSEYFLTTQTRDPATFANAIKYFWGIVDGLTFSETVVDRQRSVVANEMAPRANQDQRLYHRGLAIVPDSEWALSRGYDSKDVPTANLKTIEALYRKVYRPENVTLVIVGDVADLGVDAVLEQTFGQWRPDQGIPADLSFPGENSAALSAEPSASPYSISVDPSYGSPAAAIVGLVADWRPSPISPAGSTAADRDILERLTYQVLAHRLDLSSLDANIAGASFTTEQTLSGKRAFIWQIEPLGNDWKHALNLLSLQAARARGSSFSPHEFQTAKQIVLRQISDERQDAYLRTNSYWAEKTQRDLIFFDARKSPQEQNVTSAHDFLDNLQLEDLNRFWLSNAANAKMNYRLEGIGQPDTVPTSSDISDLIKATLDAPITSDKLQTGSDRDRPRGRREAGRIVDDRSAGGIRAVRFDNGASLRMIRRPHDGKFVELALNISLSPKSAILTQCEALALPFFLTAGGSKLNSERELREARWGSEIYFGGFEIDATSLTASASSRREDVSQALGELYEVIASPGFNPKAEAVAIGRWEQSIAAAPFDPFRSLLLSLDGQFEPSKDGVGAELQKRCLATANMARAAKVLGRILSEGGLELAVAGNIDEDQLISLFASTFGSQDRKWSTGGLYGSRPSRSDIGKPMVAQLTAANQDVVGLAWAMEQPKDAHERAVQDLFSALFARMVYEALSEKGESYAPRAQRVELRWLGGTPVMAVAVTTPSPSKGKVQDDIERIARELATNGPRQDLLETMRSLSIDGLRASYNEDRIWAFFAAQHLTRPNAMEWWRRAEEELKTIQADEIKALARDTFQTPVFETTE